MWKFPLNTAVNRQSTGLTNWTFFAVSVFVVLVFLLTDVNSCDAVDFCATTIFFVVFLGSFFMLFLLATLTNSGRTRLSGNNVMFFFLQDVNIKKLGWVPLGYFLVLGVSFLTASWDYEFAPHIGIFISGMIMLVAFFSTNAILVPVLIHGFYNATVVTLRDGIFGLSSIQVPEIGVNITFFGDYFSEIFFQIILVAGSEEFFKVFVIAFFVVATQGKFNSSGYVKWIGGIFAVLVWTIYHTISAISPI